MDTDDAASVGARNFYAGKLTWRGDAGEIVSPQGRFKVRWRNMMPGYQPTDGDPVRFWFHRSSGKRVADQVRKDWFAVQRDRHSAWGLNGFTKRAMHIYDAGCQAASVATNNCSDEGCD
jgi:hypothetical protein